MPPMGGGDGGDGKAVRRRVGVFAVLPAHMTTDQTPLLLLINSTMRPTTSSQCSTLEERATSRI